MMKKNDTNNTLNKISFDEFKNVNVLIDGVCGLKKCCIVVDYNEKKYVLKEMVQSCNFGKDYEVVDKCKNLFDLKQLGVQRIKSDKCLDRIDKNIKSWKKIGNL